MTQQDTIDRDEVARKNRDALSAIQQETGQPLPADTYSAWRPTVRTRGTIRGVTGAECVATDGVLGLFFTEGAAGPYFFGHVGWFEWVDGEMEVMGTPPTLFSTGGGGKVVVKGPKKPTRKEKLAKLLE